MDLDSTLCLTNHYLNHNAGWRVQVATCYTACTAASDELYFCILGTCVLGYGANLVLIINLVQKEDPTHIFLAEFFSQLGNWKSLHIPRHASVLVQV